MTSSKNAFEWSKDFVEHLRTVHFALVTIALALIILGLPASDRMSRAVTQASEMENLRQNWTTVSNDLVRQAFKSVHSYENVSAYIDLSMEIAADPTDPTITGHTALVMRFNANERPKVSDLQQGLEVGLSLLDKAPETLGDFKVWWNRVNSIGIHIILPDISRRPISRCSAWVDLSEAEEETIEETASPHPRCAIVAAAAQEEKRLAGSLKYFWPNPEGQPRVTFSGSIDQIDGLQIRGRSTPTRIHVEVPVSIAPVDFHEDALRDYFGDVSGDFDSTFQDLAAVTRERQFLERIPLRDLVQRVAEMQPKSEQQIEILGLKIPIVGLTTWGSLLLIAVQFYFWLHLTEFIGARNLPLDGGLSVAWIGVYSSRMATYAAITSACGAPLCAILVLAYRYLESQRSDALLQHWSLRPAIGMAVGVILVELSISAATYRSLIRLRSLRGKEARANT